MQNKRNGFNREPERFLQMKFTSDPLQIENHTTCSESFQATLYSDMRKLNKEACEQFNSLLRSVQASVSYMKFDNYLQALKIFIGFYNPEMPWLAMTFLFWLYLGHLSNVRDWMCFGERKVKIVIS